MKKVLAALGTIFGFFGLAALAIFFAETTTNTSYSLPHVSLTADISANNPAGQLADVGANIDPGAGTDEGIVPASSVETPPVDAPAVPLPPPEPQATSSPTAETPVTVASPPLVPTLAENVPITSTVATVTITVTPTAPPPSLPPEGSTPRAPVTGGIALPYEESSFRDDHDWQTTWGTMITTWSGFMDLSAGTGGTGGAVYLKNSMNWANYTMSAMVDWIGGQTIGLMANYGDASNYVLCEYAKTGPGTIMIRLLQHVKGQEIVLSPDAAIPWNGDGSNLNLSIKVGGVYGTCSLNGQTVSNDTIGPGRSAMNSPGSGGIGFAVSDPLPNTSEIVVKHVSVMGML